MKSQMSTIPFWQPPYALAWLVGGSWLLWCLTSVSAQSARWETTTRSGGHAPAQGHMSAPVPQVQMARATGEEEQQDVLRLTAGLMQLAQNHDTQGQYAAAVSLYNRVLRLQEQAFGPEHPHLVDVLLASAAGERKLYPVRSRLPWSSAQRLEARARRLQQREVQTAVEEAAGAWFSTMHVFSGNEP